MAKAEKTQAERLGEKLIVASTILVFAVAVSVIGKHDKATASDGSQLAVTTTTEVSATSDSIPPLETPVEQASAQSSATQPPQTSIPKKAPATTAVPTPVEEPRQTANVVLGGVELIGCKPKPGVDVNAWWASYMKDAQGSTPYWPAVRSAVCA